MKALRALVGEYLAAVGARDEDGSITRAVAEWLGRIPRHYGWGLRVYLAVLGVLPRSLWDRLPAMRSVHKLLKSLTYLSWSGP